MDKAPERIWADPPETFDGMDIWRSEPGGKSTEYIRADIVPQWQPIETAPKDRDILVIQTQNNIIRVARGINDHGYWRTGISPMEYIVGVSHWMPLPSPPA